MKSKCSACLAGAFLLLGFVAVPPSARAQLSIEITATPLMGGTFHYDISITNNGAQDVSLITLDAPVSDSLIAGSLLAPNGFQASYDPIGFLDFLEDTDLFAVGTTKGIFSFDSRAAPFTSFNTYEALTPGGNTFSGATNTFVIPEPASACLFLAGCALLISAARHRCRRAM